ncbi:MAG: Smr/MutS family protein [Deltaproteobacteria bacterium]|nr:Smr/MutS family protein [Deltaproteobacteria bacterium]
MGAGRKRKGGHEGFNAPFRDLGERLEEARRQAAAAARAVPAPPPAPAPASTARSTPADEEDLFLTEMAGVTRLDPQVRERASAPPPPPVRPRAARDDEAEAYARLCDLVEGEGPFDIADTQEYIEGIAPGIDRRLLHRLRHGDYAVQAHLDLHGLTAEVAKPRVQTFVQAARAASQRCVLIVHGRGLNSKDHIPVLKERLRLWLTRGRVARSVLCFATARPYDGGAGAVYVLLRR